MRKSKFKRLKLKQLSDSVKKKDFFQIDKVGQRIKDIREALGITQRQLANKLKVKQPAISQIEENIESSSLKTVAKVLRALECELAIGIVSNVSLEDLVKKQAERVAKKMLDRTYSNMALEKQALTKKGYKYDYKELVEDLLENPGPELWEE